MTIKWMTAAALTGILVGAPSTASTQPGGAQPGGTQTGTQSASASRPAGSAEDGQFIERMMMANMAEIQLGQLASTRARNDEVKAYGQMMVADHTKANQQLQPLAQRMGRQAPTELDEKHQAIAKRLSALDGEEFDREFMRVMVQSHQEVLQDAKTKAAGAGGGPATSGTSGTAGRPSGTPGAATGTSGSSTPSSGTAPAAGPAPQSATEYAANTAPVVQQHLDHAQRLQKSMER